MLFWQFFFYFSVRLSTILSVPINAGTDVGSLLRHVVCEAVVHLIDH